MFYHCTSNFWFLNAVILCYKPEFLKHFPPRINDQGNRNGLNILKWPEYIKNEIVETSSCLRAYAEYLKKANDDQK